VELQVFSTGRQNMEYTTNKQLLMEKAGSKSFMDILSSNIFKIQDHSLKINNTIKAILKTREVLDWYQFQNFNSSQKRVKD